MKEVQKQIIRKNRKNYSRLFQDYRRLDSFKSINERIKKNKYKRTMQFFLGMIGFDIITYLISLFCFFKHYTVAVIIYWIILAVVNVLITLIITDKLERYRNEMIVIRDSELCELLSKNNVNSQNITNVIEYFKLELEPINEVYKEFPVLNSISSFWSNLFFLILGIIASSLVDINLEQNKTQTYSTAIAILTFILLVIVIIRGYVFLERKDKYADQTRKLIVELKRIELLNRYK